MRPAAPRWLLALLLAIVPMLAVGNFFAYHAPGQRTEKKGAEEWSGKGTT